MIAIQRATRPPCIGQTSFLLNSGTSVFFAPSNTCRCIAAGVGQLLLWCVGPAIGCFVVGIDGLLFVGPVYVRCLGTSLGLLLWILRPRSASAGAASGRRRRAEQPNSTAAEAITYTEAPGGRCDSRPCAGFFRVSYRPVRC